MSAAAEEAPAATVRRVVRSSPLASLGTLFRDTGGAPYVSLVNAAADHDGSPLLLLSELADHTRNLGADARASLLFDASGAREDPLAGERVTLQGRLLASAEPGHRSRYLARHPIAAMYAGFKDFHIYRMTVERAHLVAGFGRIHWLEAALVLVEPAPALIGREADILAHMNADHQDAIDAYASGLLGLTGSGWRLTGIDPEGVDLRRGQHSARLSFEQQVSDAESARHELVRLARLARERQAAAS